MLKSKKKRSARLKKAQPGWATVRVSSASVKRASAVRDLLLTKGQDVLPPKLRGVVTVPAGDRKVVLRRFGIGQVLDLALTALEQATDGRS